ncbi:hypothetical protein [Paenibacillus lentus]|uniref:hypothetical protein n=1 Tax=Paenibacillus lentus TaxID=1338368 RepID=UPI0013DDDFC9|nr:hypothetical protein [Paenibacillus lentus]
MAGNVISCADRDRSQGSLRSANGVFGDRGQVQSNFAASTDVLRREIPPDVEF